jgi:MOSC domain-containing protein YiiM
VAVLERIWLTRMKLGPMDPQVSAQLVAGRGLVGNRNQGGRQQVTILSRTHWDRLTAHLPGPRDPIMRRASLLVSDLDFANARHQILRIGSARVRVLGETRPCERMEEA